jgi:hypothetical protein
MIMHHFANFRHAQRTAVHAVFYVVALLFSQMANSHTFFESIVNIDANPSSGKLEIVHSYTRHDLIAVLMKQTQLEINLEQAEHEKLLRDYIEQHFKLRAGKNLVMLEWIGIQITPHSVEIYQESREKQDLTRIELQQTVLLDSLPKQINRVNYQQGNTKGTVIFAREKKWLPLK